MDTNEFPALPDLATALPGYRLTRPLAVTAMSVVYQAEESALGRDVAVKILHPNVASDASFRERFDREVSIAVSIAHPNVIPIHAKGEQDGVHYVAMQYVDGPDLGQLIRDKGRLRLPETVQIARQVASALDAAHEKGLVHRDVKPGNVLLDRRTRHAYLCDFGIARPVDTSGLTTAGQFVGTTGYAAPEQIHGAKIDRHADQYALGCAIYQCLTGEPPFPGSDTSAVLWSHMNEPPPRATERVPELPAAVDAVLVRAMAKRPEDRYPSCAALVAALAEVSDAATSVPQQRGPENPDAVTATPSPNTSMRRLSALARSLGALTHKLAAEHRRVRGDGTGPPGSDRRQVARNRLLWGCACGTVLLVVLGVLVWPSWASGISPDQLKRVPAELRSGCERLDTTARPGASTSLKCRDADGLAAVFSFFTTAREAAVSYDKVVREANVKPGTGDCGTVTGSEHQYPGVGSSQGRVLCQTPGRLTIVTWVDDLARTVASAESADLGGNDLVSSWSRWVKVPTFATDAEDDLMSAIHHRACQRAPRGSLDSFPGAVAAVECNLSEDGVRTVSAYRFRHVEHMKRSYDRHVAEADAPSGVFCGDQPDGFLGTDDYARFDIHAGDLLCYQGDRGEWIVEWTVDPLRIHYKAVGDDPEKLVDWWAGEGPSHEEFADAVNARADPPFPTAEEKKLLRHIPDQSQVNCIRVPRHDLLKMVSDDGVTGVNCGPTPGASYVYYLQFTEVESLRKEYGGAPESGARKCSSRSSKFHGDGTYERDGKFVGWLYCDVDDDGDPYLVWTHEPLKILVLAYGAEKPSVALDWWRFQAGPV